MASTCAYNVFVGAETGLLKGVQSADGTWQNLNAVADTNRSREITSLCWGSAEKTGVYAALRDNCVLVFDSSGASSKEYGPFFGAAGHIKSVARYDDRFLTGFSEGMLAVWPADADEEQSKKISTGDNLWAFAQNIAEPNVVATGGKENPVKLWDMSSMHDVPVFSSKNVKNDWLNLRVPIWVTKLQFLGDNRRIVAGTGYSQIRVYDTKSSQRRPVIDFKFLDNPITALSVCPYRDDQVVVGNTMGDMGLLDLRKSRTVQLYKGFAGGITDIQCHPTAPVIVSCSIDRYLRIHDIENKTLLQKLYLKSRLNCLLVSDDWPEPEEKSRGVRKVIPKTNVENANAYNESDGEGVADVMWNSLESVKTKTVGFDKPEVGVKRKTVLDSESKQDKLTEKKRKKKKKL